MAKFISKNTKKNIDKVRKRLEKEKVTLKILGEPNQEMLAGEALLLGGNLMKERKEFYALQIATQLEEKFSDIVDVHLLKIRALLELEELVEAQQLINKLLKMAPNNIGILISAIRLNVILGDIDGALKYLRLANKLKPNNIETLFQAAECYRYSGELNRARKTLHKCLDITSKRRFKNEITLKQYITTLCRLARSGEITNTQCEDLAAVLTTSDFDAGIKSACAYALSNQAQRKKSISDEIVYLKQANKWEAESVGHTKSNDLYETECREGLLLQQKVFSEANPDWLKGFTSEGDDSPILILGMPRSGTTLIEQILGAHSDVGQTGESKALGIGVSRAYRKHQPAYGLTDFPRGFAKTSFDTLNQIISYYTAHQKLLTDKKTYVDKDLANFKFAGLMANLFSGAKFIHMNRAPLDIFLSCYKNSIPGVPTTTNLAHMAIRYIYMKKMIGHWLSLYPDRVFILDYAELVADPETHIKLLLSFLGLEFQPQMMEFYKRKNVVRTLSMDQVRNSIYKTSVEKWRPYSEVLAPAIQVLNDHNIDTNGVRFL